MKQTKKEIIKNMLVQAINSPEQLDLFTCEEMNKLNMYNDDEKIKFIDELFKKFKPKNFSFRSILRTRPRIVLTNRTYLLLEAYKHSASRLNEYGKFFNRKATEIIKEAHTKASIYTQLERDCFILKNTIETKRIYPNYVSYGEHRWSPILND